MAYKKTQKTRNMANVVCNAFKKQFNFYFANLLFEFCWLNAGILRYKVDFQSLQADEPLEDVDLDDY